MLRRSPLMMASLFRSVAIREFHAPNLNPHDFGETCRLLSIVSQKNAGSLPKYLNEKIDQFLEKDRAPQKDYLRKLENDLDREIHRSCHRVKELIEQKEVFFEGLRQEEKKVDVVIKLLDQQIEKIKEIEISKTHLIKKPVANELKEVIHFIIKELMEKKEIIMDGLKEEEKKIDEVIKVVDCQINKVSNKVKEMSEVLQLLKDLNPYSVDCLQHIEESAPRSRFKI